MTDRRICSLVLYGALALAAGRAAGAAPPEVAVSGTVRSALSGQPLDGARIAARDTAREARSGPDGAWRLQLPAGDHVLELSHPEHLPLTRAVTVSAGLVVDLALDPRYRVSEEVVVQAVRAEARTPVTRHEVTRADIERRHVGQEMPFLLKPAPSLNQYSDSGLGSGYSYLYLRGIQQTRVNMTLDGVPLNEPEDSTVYFVNFGDFASSLESVQVQRGVGTSTVGVASYAGSINFASRDLAEEREADARLGLGSFGTRRGSAGAQSGRVGPGLAFYGRGSYMETDGFKRHSGVVQRSAFFGATRQGPSDLVKVFAFAGRERTQLAFYATPLEVLEQDPRANPASPDERDSFGQGFAHAHYTRTLGAASSLGLQGYYGGAGGWYRLQDAGGAGLLQYGLRWHLAGGIGTFRYAGRELSLTLGVHGNGFASRHTRTPVDGPQEYSTRGLKNEANAFAKAGWDRGPWHLYGDAQLRWSRFRHRDGLPLGSVAWTFFNPKLGARRDLAPGLSAYLSLGRTTREPTRADLFSGQDNPTILYDLRAVRPERVVNLEAGLELRRGSLALHAGAYAMEFRNEIALTGELSEIGLPLRRNVDRSRRRGVELDAAWQAVPALRLTASAYASFNRIRSWTQFLDVYDEAGAYLESVPRAFSDVEPLLTPRAIVNLGADYTPRPWLRAGLSGRYVARSYLDNTNVEALTTPRFFELDASLALGLERWVRAGRPRLRLELANLLDNDRIWPNGYSYLFLTRGASGPDQLQHTPYYYPLATRSVLVLLDLGL
jgi:iron complex outermembrane receptor protein